MTIIESLKQCENAEYKTAEAAEAAADAAKEAEANAGYPSEITGKIKPLKGLDINKDYNRVVAERDGYVRKTPVQEIYTPASYKSMLLLRVIAIVVIVVAVALLVCGLWNAGLLVI